MTKWSLLNALACVGSHEDSGRLHSEEPGEAWQSLALDGTGGHVELGASSSFNPAAFFVECWVRGESFGEGVGGAPLVSSLEGDGDEARGFALDVGDRRLSLTVAGAGTTAIALAEAPVAPGEWVHLAGQFDGEILTVYINGEPSGDASKNSGIGVSSAGLRVGASADGAALDGYIDEVHYSTDSPLTGRFTPNYPLEADSMTIGIWHLNGDAKDAAGGERHGVLVGAATWSEQGVEN